MFIVYIQYRTADYRNRVARCNLIKKSSSYDKEI